MKLAEVLTGPETLEKGGAMKVATILTPKDARVLRRVHDQLLGLIRETLDGTKPRRRARKPRAKRTKGERIAKQFQQAAAEAPKGTEAPKPRRKPSLANVPD